MKKEEKQLKESELHKAAEKSIRDNGISFGSTNTYNDCLDAVVEFACSSEVRKYHSNVDKLDELRDKLYDSLPSGHIEAWQLLEIIKKHITALDKVIYNSKRKQ